MAKFPRQPKLDKQTMQEIVTDLCEAVAQAKDPAEAAELLTDLLGRQELEMVARRLRVAEMLLEDMTYADISKELKISTATIARVQVWLHEAGEGYRKIIERTKAVRKRRKEGQQISHPSGLKKKYPIYFWPQIMLDHWMQTSTEKQKSEMLGILSKVNDKSRAFKELRKQLTSSRL
jgi:TrpR-related protein YerC/YecD